MEVTAKQKTEYTDAEVFELHEIAEMQSVDDKKVDVKKPLGKYRLEQLEADKEFLEQKLADINTMIAAINELKK
ncbi:MAG TPA: hypothetical protein VMW32_00695 [Bacteroidales bacterium]|nr:hypothetical protein [Bacteroidales bacterium]